MKNRRFRVLIMLLITGIVGCGGPGSDIANRDSTGSAIVCFGDSLTTGHGARKGEDYPSQLSRLVRRPVLNAGRDGDTTARALERLKRDVLAKNPRIVVVLLGGNDALQKVPKNETVSNLDLIVGRCVDAGSMVIVVHGKYGMFKDPYRDEFEAIAKRRRALFVPRVLKDVLGRPSMMNDQIHPNGKGYALVARRIADAMTPIL